MSKNKAGALDRNIQGLFTFAKENKYVRRYVDCLDYYLGII